MSAIPYRAEIFFWPAGSPQTRRPRGPQLILPRRRAPHRYPQTTKTPPPPANPFPLRTRRMSRAGPAKRLRQESPLRRLSRARPVRASPARSTSPAPNGVTNTQSPAPATNTPGNESTAVGRSARRRSTRAGREHLRRRVPPGPGRAARRPERRLQRRPRQSQQRRRRTGADGRPTGTDSASRTDSASGTDRASRDGQCGARPHRPRHVLPRARHRKPSATGRRPHPRAVLGQGAGHHDQPVGQPAARPPGRAGAGRAAAIPAPQPGAAAVSGGRWWRLCWPWSSWRWPGCSCPVP